MPAKANPSFFISVVSASLATAGSSAPHAPSPLFVLTYQHIISSAQFLSTTTIPNPRTRSRLRSRWARPLHPPRSHHVSPLPQRQPHSQSTPPNDPNRHVRSPPHSQPQRPRQHHQHRHQNRHLVRRTNSRAELGVGPRHRNGFEKLELRQLKQSWSTRCLFGSSRARRPRSRDGGKTPRRPRP